MKRTLAVAATALALAAAPAAGWGAPVWDVSVDVGVLSGDSTYQIGGTVTDNYGGYELQWPLSELKWPLDCVMASVGGSASFGPVSLQLRVGANLTDEPGEMEDSDWGVYYLDSGGNPSFSTDSLDIFSTSDVTMEAAVLDLKGRFGVFRPGFYVAGGIGLLYQEFSFEARGVDQYSPSWQRYGIGYDPYRYVGPPNELAIAYEVTYIIPYVEIAAGWPVGSWVTIDASVGFSPIALAEDTDDHVLRGKLSEGECDGTALMANLGVKVKIGRHFFGAAGVNYLNIDTDGTQTQSYYADPSLIGYEAEIDHTITSSQTGAYLRGGVTF